MFKKILLKNKLWFFLTSFSIVLSSILMVYAGYSLSFLFRAMEYDTNSIKHLINDGIKVTLIWLFALLFLYLKNIVRAYTISKIRNDLRENVTYKIMDLSYEEFHTKDTGNFVSWLTSDVNQITEQSFLSFFNIIDNVATSIFALIAMIKLNFYIGLTAVILFAAIALVPKAFGKLMAKISEKLSTDQEKFVESIKEIIMGYDVFKLYNLFSTFQTRLKMSSEKIENTRFQYSKKQAFVSIVISTVNLIGQVVLIVVTLYLAIRSSTPVGAVLSVGNLAGSFFSGVSGSVEGIVSRKASKPIFNKFLLNEDTSIEKKELTNLERIAINDLSFSYGENNILKEISTEFEVGKKYAVIGASGSGKSTFAKILLGFLPNYNGEIFLNDLNFRELSSASIYRQISYISQNVYLFQGSIRDNITLGEEFTDDEIYKALEKSRLINFVKNTPYGLDFIIQENGKNLSGGQRQRLALARSIIRKVKFIIVDEGTSSLDKENAMEIERNLLSTEDFGVIIITHHLSDEISNKLDGIYTINCVTDKTMA